MESSQIFLGVDGHDFIYDRANECDFSSMFDWLLCNNSVFKNNNNLETYEKPQVICIKTDFLPKYVELLESLNTGNFVLVSCSSSYSPSYFFPSETRRILKNPYLVAWYAENNTGILIEQSDSGTGAKVLPDKKLDCYLYKLYSLPSGLNYHNRAKKRDAEDLIYNFWKEYIGGGEESPVTHEQFISCKIKTVNSVTPAVDSMDGSYTTILYCSSGGSGLMDDSYCKNFCGLTHNIMRDFLSWISAVTTGELGSVSYIPSSVATSAISHKIHIYHLIETMENYGLKEYFNVLSKYLFLLCPCEGTLDPFPRVWEALAMGVIPIMLYNPYVEEMYRGFPIWFVDSWEECILSTQIYYKNKYNFLMSSADAEWTKKLTVSYWNQKIRDSLNLPPLYIPHDNSSPIIDIELQLKPFHEWFHLKDGGAGSCWDVANVWSCCEGEISTPTIGFSFCIYGKNKMYYIGLRDNIKQIIRFFGYNAKIFIFAGVSVNLNYLKKMVSSYVDYLTIIKTDFDGVINMIYRYSPAVIAATENIDYLFVRDADSLIEERDLWCIFDFLNFMRRKELGTDSGRFFTNNSHKIVAHVVRDHFHHKSKLTGGLTGLTRGGMNAIQKILYEEISKFHEGEHNTYGADEIFLNSTLYDVLRNAGTIFVHSSFCEFPGEIRRPILFKNTLTNFAGNVVQREPYKHMQFLYNDCDIHAQFRWCRDNQAPPELFIHTIISLRTWHDIKMEDFLVNVMDAKDAARLEDNLYHGIMQLPYNVRSKTISYLIQCFLDIDNILGAKIAYRLFAYCEVDTEAKTTLFRRFLQTAQNEGKKIYFLTEGVNGITFDTHNIYIVYGNYPDDWNAYPSSNIIRRNVWFYTEDFSATAPLITTKPVWLENMVWENVCAVFLMGLKEAPQRIYETMAELSRVGINLQKLHVYKAQKDNSRQGAYLGATKNHLDCLELAFSKTETEQPQKVVLFLEDDFVFIKEPQNILRGFFDSIPREKYDVCFLAASKMHERRRTIIKLYEAENECIMETRQYCTTSSGYFVPVGSLKYILNIVKDGYEKLEKTGDSNYYCIDRYWTKIQSTGRMIMLKEKVGFQRPSMSKITGELNVMLD